MDAAVLRRGPRHREGVSAIASVAVLTPLEQAGVSNSETFFDNVYEAEYNSGTTALCLREETDDAFLAAMCRSLGARAMLR